MSAVYALMKDDRAIAALREATVSRASIFLGKAWQETRRLGQQLPDRRATTLSLDQPVVAIGEALAEAHPDRLAVMAMARALIPWKKGPFNLFGCPIDGEWRADFKWNRLAEDLGDLRDQTILDLGCNNGYFMFRAAAQQPRLVLGIDPVPRVNYQFQLLQRYAQLPNLEMQPWGWQELTHWQSLFDTVFCMGIIYHHSDPIRILKDIYRALKPGGRLVLETIVIPGENPHCLFPPDRYARMRNVWFIPTVTALNHFLERTRYTHIRTISVAAHRPEEQRTTAWNPGPSYADFVLPDQPELTVEGLPAPHRAILVADKPA